MKNSKRDGAWLWCSLLDVLALLWPHQTDNNKTTEKIWREFLFKKASQQKTDTDGIDYAVKRKRNRRITIDTDVAKIAIHVPETDLQVSSSQFITIMLTHTQELCRVSEQKK